MDRQSTPLHSTLAAAPPSDSYRSNMAMFSPSFAQTAAYRHWRNIGGRHQLYTDEEIACFLMNCYDKSLSSATLIRERCTSCGCPVGMYCVGCERHLEPSNISSRHFGISEHDREVRCRPGGKTGHRKDHSTQTGAPKTEEQAQNNVADIKEFPVNGESPPPPPQHSHPQRSPPSKIHNQNRVENSQHRHQQQQAPPPPPPQQKQFLQQNLLSSQQNLQHSLTAQLSASQDHKISRGENVWGGGGEESLAPSTGEGVHNYGTGSNLGSAGLSTVESSLWGSAGVSSSMDQQFLDGGQRLVSKQKKEEVNEQTQEQDWQRPPSPFSGSDSPPPHSSQEQDSEDHPDQDQEKTPPRKRKKSEQELFCGQCNKQLSSRQAFDRHVKSKLHAISLLPPDVQARRRRRQRAANPQQTNQDKSVYFVAKSEAGEEYLCKVCGQAFGTVPEVKQHRRQHKDREMCHLCGKTINVRGFRDHMLRHRGERQHSCELCSKTFINAALLKDHAIVHTSEKPFCCEMCGACFRHRHTLKFHLRMHSGVKAYCCGQCHAAFTRPRGLSDHMRVHTGERPYGCQVCGRYFSSSGNLAAHRRKVHKMPPLLPSVPCRLLMT
ncbi:hypothetical protein ACOMHN_041941 [Nucella lapillus]